MFDFIMGLALGILFVAIVLAWMISRAVSDFDDRMEEFVAALEKQIQENVISARVEEHDGMFYIYNVRDDSFLGQGRCIQELTSRVEERMRDVRVYITQGDADVLARLKASGSEATHA
jgi:hypothetical protein